MDLSLNFIEIICKLELDKPWPSYFAYVTLLFKLMDTHILSVLCQIMNTFKNKKNLSGVNK